MKVAVIDCSISGHRETYYREFTRAWAALGAEVMLVAPRPSGTEAVAAFSPVNVRPLLPLPVGQPLRKKLTVLQNARLRLHNLAAISRQVRDFHPDLVYFPCLDDMLPTLSFPAWTDHVFPYAWSGLLVQSALPAYHWYLPDVRPALRSRLCRGVGVLNEYSAEELRHFQPNVTCLPDFADFSQPDVTYPLAEEVRRRAAGRKVVSLLGSIGERKGVRLLLDVIRQLPADKYFFVMAGRPWLTGELLQAVKAVAAARENCLFALEQIPDEACFNALVTASDVLFAVYRHFTGSSNLLTKAAAFGRPILVSEGLCMGRRVEHYGIGLTTSETDTDACCHALAVLCSEGAPRPEGFREYAEVHNIERLKDSLALLMKHT